MKKAYYFLLMLILVVAASPIYAGEVATFESFYTESLGWSILIWSVIAAAILGAIVYFTGGLASPLVAGPAAAIGTMIGKAMGLYGIAATNAGLALLGGGSIASGGLGMAGGAALITAALEFSTALIAGYTIESYNVNSNQATFLEQNYDRAAFREQSKVMVKLPLPVNPKGSEPYEAVIEILQNIDKEKPLSFSENKALIETALQVSGKPIKNEWTNVEEKKLQFMTLRALLLVSIDKYNAAKTLAEESVIYAKIHGYKRTLPLFIYALCSLYDEKVDVNKTNTYFREAILEEPDNLLTPILFAAYLDRLVYRYRDDGVVNEADIKQIALIAANRNIKEYAIANLSAIMVRYFTLIKDHQQIITVIANTANKTIRNNPLTIKKLTSSMDSYNKLLEDGQLILRILLKQSLDHLNDEQRTNTIKELKKFRSLMNEYISDRKRLSLLARS